jgi:hypothetical protein
MIVNLNRIWNLYDQTDEDCDEHVTRIFSSTEEKRNPKTPNKHFKLWNTDKTEADFLRAGVRCAL